MLGTSPPKSVIVALSLAELFVIFVTESVVTLPGQTGTVKVLFAP